MSLIDPLACGFAKAFVYNKLVSDCGRLGKNISKADISKVYDEHVDDFNRQFSTYFSTTSVTYKRNFIKIKDLIFNLGKKCVDNKSSFLSIFSFESWNDLKASEKSKHNLFRCNGCIRQEKFRIPLSYLPIKNVFLKRKADEAGLFIPKKQKIVKAASETLKEVNTNFIKENNISFQKAL